MILHPEKLRFSGIQNVSLNLPQCAYRAFPEEDGTRKAIKDNHQITKDEIEQFFTEVYRFIIRLLGISPRF